MVRCVLFVDDAVISYGKSVLGSEYQMIDGSVGMGDRNRWWTIGTRALKVVSEKLHRLTVWGSVEISSGNNRYFDSFRCLYLSSGCIQIVITSLEMQVSTSKPVFIVIVRSFESGPVCVLGLHAFHGWRFDPHGIQDWEFGQHRV